MRLIIDIPEEDYQNLKAKDKFDDMFLNYYEKLIVRGTPLPKGHGRLIDVDAYRKEMLDSREFDFFKRLDMQPTIIEADKESEVEE